jgi:hypothetical protein
MFRLYAMPYQFGPCGVSIVIERTEMAQVGAVNSSGFDTSPGTLGGSTSQGEYTMSPVP